MSSSSAEPRLNRRTVTMDETKVLREVVQRSTLQPITPTKRETSPNSAAPTAGEVLPEPVQEQYRVTPQSTPIHEHFPQQMHHLSQQYAQQTMMQHPTQQPINHYSPPPQMRQLPPIQQPLPQPTRAQAECAVLVINASQSMAHEITLELSRTLPGSTILFAPTLSLALWILKRRKINLILSSAVLPDGAISTLHEFIEVMSPPPELVVLSDLYSTRTELGSHPGYRFVEMRRVSPRLGESAPPIHSRISELGANLRNDLNNPLQEIVAMAFVAHTSHGLSPMAEEALSAIQRAAGNMAEVVNRLEDKIRVVVSAA